ncbi:beta-galactosidase [Streptomyces sp. NPDC090106]|uniref:glycoside hydrolase family 35 protein n=1 Tax=Streptomyces sp. NPDC090106 TaxID=3365946 RepID=UPI00381697E7
MDLSRRTFSALAGTTALGLALTGSAGVLSATPRRPRYAPTGPPPPTPAADGYAHSIGYDRYSLLVDNRRLVVWSGEMHPFRLPSPSLWRDVLQKMRAHGYNTVSAHVAWNFHSPAPGTYDFTGVRDLDLFLTMAAETGLYVVLRPGPYIGADVDAGGFPGWLTATEGRARTDDPVYLGHVDQWLTEVDAIVVGHQYTQGTGTVLLYQIENEYDVTDATGRAYMSHLYEKVRADGIDVPLFHNDRGRNGHWAPGSFDTGGEKGSWLYGFDAFPEPDTTPPDWGAFGATRAAASPKTPGFLPEFGGGRSDGWGGAASGGKGYAESRRTRDAAYERRFHLTSLANGITLHNVYMTFGGTSWGWLPAPQVYTSYDHGAAIDEGRRQTGKLAPMHQTGHLLRQVPDLAKLDRAKDITSPDPRLTVYHLANPDTDAQVYVVRNDSAEDVSTPIPDAGIEVPVTVPARDARLLTANLRLGGRTLRYATAQLAMFVSAGRQDIAVFTGRYGDMAQVVLECPEEPEATRLDAEPAWIFDRGLLRINAPLGVGLLSRVMVENGGSDRPLLVLFADDATALRLWPYETPSGTALVYGPSLVRSVSVQDSIVQLTGDTAAATGMEVWGPRGIGHVTWNGQPVATRTSATGSLLSLGQLPGPAPVTLPVLDGWRRRAENPESAPDFDDSAWAEAEPDALPADGHGFHYGDVWYRGRLTDAADVESLSLAYSTGTQGLLMAWLDGKPLGTHRMPVPDERTARQGTWTATASFKVPKKLRERDTHVLSALVRRMQHDLDDTSQDTHKAARGLTSVTFKGGSPRTSWRLQGEGPADALRGPLNNGGLFGEREGWHLPELDDSGWEAVKSPREDRRQGVTWYRTSFRLSVGTDVDASVALTLDDDPERAYRVQIFLNGWNMGQYVNDVGPQHDFVLPNGILRTRGVNSLALAVLSDGTTDSGPRDVRLKLLGTTAGGVGVQLVGPTPP